jgi:RNA polymerase I-specific transcription initiation factor RRN10
MNTQPREYGRLNVFESCSGEVKRGVHLNRDRAHELFPGYKGDKRGLFARILASDDPELYHNRGHAVPPDEILQHLNPSAVRIPLRAREDFVECPLPLLELLKVLHYYASHQVEAEASAAQSPQLRAWLARSMDETALLALGVLVEEMAERLVEEGGVNIFLEPDADEGVGGTDVTDATDATDATDCTDATDGGEASASEDDSSGSISF